jgi:hypothetical protein
MKKIISLLLSIVMIASAFFCVDFSAIAAYSGSFGQLSWNLQSNTGVLTISGNGEMEYSDDVPWSEYKDSIKSVNISEGVTSICDYAFYRCRNLVDVGISNTVVEIGSDAFNECTSLEKIILPESLTKIGNFAFSYCSALKEITIPKNVTEIGWEQFAGCENLETINWDAKQAYVLTNNSYTYLFNSAGENAPNGLTINFTDSCEYVDGDHLFDGYLNNYVTTINIGRNVNEGHLTVGSYYKDIIVNYNCEKDGLILETLNYITSVNSGYQYVAKGCTLNIGESVKTINRGWDTFDTINVDTSNIEKVASGAFQEYTLDKINKIISSDDLSSVKIIEEYAFYNSEINFVPHNVEIIGYGAFENCKSLREIHFSKNLKQIEDHAFKDTKIEKIFFDGTVQEWNSINSEFTGLNSVITICSDGVLNCDHNNRVYESVGSPSQIIYRCEDCGSVFGICENQALHNFELVESIEPTCEADGYVKYICSICNKEFIGKPVSDDELQIKVASDEYPESLHNYSNNIDQTAEYFYEGASQLSLQFSEETSVENGYDFIYVYGKDDFLIGQYTGNDLSNQTINVEGDRFKIRLTSNYNNTDYGYSFNNITATAKTGSEEYNYLKASGHDYSVTKVVSPQCNKQGYTVYTCSNCNNTYNDNFVEATGSHCYVKKVTQATSTTQGYTTYTCAVCGETYKADYFDPATVYSEEISATAGQTVKVPVMIRDNAGIMGWKLTFDYDTDVLTPLSVEYGEVISGGLQDNIEGDMVPGSINVYWAGSDNEYYNGVMFYINFAVNESAVGNTQIDISFSQEDTFDTDFNDVYLNCEPISLNISNSSYSQYAKINAYANDVVAGDDLQLKLNISEINSVSGADIVVGYDAENFEFKEVLANGVTVKNSNSNGDLTLNISKISEAVNNTDFITVIFKCKDKAMSGKYDFALSSEDEGVICKGCSINVSPSATSEIAEIYAEDVTAKQNDEITIPVYIENNHGVMGYRLDFEYDADILQPISATCGSDFITGSQFNDSIGLKEGEFKVLWNNISELYADGVLFNLKFKVLTSEKADTTIKMTYSQPDTFNEQYEDVVFDCQNIKLSLNAHEHSYTAVVTPPTCTEEGYTTYTCSCGDSYIDDYVPAAGHKWGEYISNNDATYDSDGTKTATCSVCGATDTVVDEGSQLKKEPDLSTFTIKTVSLTLQSSIKMNFKVLKSALAEYEDPYMVFKCEGLEDMTVTEYTEQGEYYVFSFPGISPKMMNNTVTAQLYATYKENGHLYSSETKSISVKEYAYKMLDAYASINTTQANKLKTLIVDLLNYGAEAQVYTNYKTNSLVNEDLTATQKSWGTSTTPELTNITDKEYRTISNPTAEWNAAGLVLNDSVKIRAKFTVEDIENITVRFTCAGSTYTYSKEDFTKNSDGSYYVYCNEIKANQMSNEILITVYDNGVQCSNTMRFSVESYAKAIQDSAYAGTALDNLTQAMMRYGKSAEAYGS